MSPFSPHFLGHPEARAAASKASGCFRGVLDNEQLRYLRRHGPDYFDIPLRWVLSHVLKVR
jgi:hypothetical protein